MGQWVTPIDSPGEMTARRSCPDTRNRTPPMGLGDGGEQRGHLRLLVPAAVVRRRFRLGWGNFQNVYRLLVDRWEMYDNSGPAPVLVLKETRHEGTVEAKDQEDDASRSSGLAPCGGGSHRAGAPQRHAGLCHAEERSDRRRREPTRPQ